MNKRIIISTVFTVLLFITLTVRIGYIIFSKSYEVSDTYNSYSILLDTLEPNLYYSNYSRITNNAIRKYSLIKPEAAVISDLKSYGIDSKVIEKELKDGKPVLIESELVNGGSFKTFFTTYSDNNCSQLVSKESSGLLKYLPEKIGERRLSFLVDAKGRMLVGDDGTIVDDNYSSGEGVVLTLEENVQNIAVQCSSSIKSGCVLIMDVQSGKLLACVTKPDSSYINKPFQLYTVGSVFKIIIAACALENGITPEYECNGSIKAGDTVYSCQNNKKHGRQSLEDALCNSCNCYFVNLALILGADKIYQTAKSFGFGESINIYNDWKIEGSSLPSLSELKGEGELPLIGFGQGKLMTTPLQMCRALCAVASGGELNCIKLVEAETDYHGERKEISYPTSKQIISKRTSYLLTQYLRSVVENGTAANADYNNNSAGKTATAQTGQYINGKEILNTWFAGFYPFDEPKYAIVIMCENGKSGAEDCCPVFSTIVEKLDNM